MRDFWSRVRKLLELKGLRQIDVELALDLNPSFISQSTARGTIPRADVAMRLADYFGVTVKWLVTGKDNDSLDPKLVVVISNKPIMELAYEISLCTEESIELIHHVVSCDRKRSKRT